MSESRVCEHGHVYGCPECDAARRALVRQHNPPSAASAPRQEPDIPTLGEKWRARSASAIADNEFLVSPGFDVQRCADELEAALTAVPPAEARPETPPAPTDRQE